MRTIRWSLLAVAIALSAAPAGERVAQDRSLDLLTATIREMQAAVGAGGLTYERLLQLYLRRIGAFDKQGPQLNAVIAINPHALETARALDAERRMRGVRSP